jgi:hypothetical protein
VGRRPYEPPNADLRSFYTTLIDCLAKPEFHDGEFRLHASRSAWEGNPTFDDLIVFSWSIGSARVIVAVNYAPHPSQGYTVLELEAPSARVLLVDRFSDARYERCTRQLAERGLYLDMPPWGHHMFDCVEQP